MSVAEGPRAARRAGDDGLWALTAYFNPMRYRRRRANYRVFRERLNVPLVAVELAYGRDFELTEGDADVLIHLRGRDIMWQKERLLAVALRALPSSCRKVVWTDCDVVFASEDWADRVSELLERFTLVQAFSHVHHLSPRATTTDTASEILYTRPSAALAIGSGTLGRDRFKAPTVRSPGPTNHGLAWSARRELLDESGFYDAGIVGGGDRAMICAADGCFDAATQTMSDLQAEHYLAWARPYHEMVRGEIGFSDGHVFHLWHGDMDDRRYRRRYDGLRRYEFDPLEDIVHAENGAWRWRTAKPDLHRYVRNYFAARNEDG